MTEGMNWGEKQHALGHGLQKWAHEYPLLAQRLKDLEGQLYQVQQMHPAIRDFALEQKLRKEFEEAHMQLELFWHQR
jgi:hypothetical protein